MRKKDLEIDKLPCVPGAAEGCLSLKSRAQPEKCLATTNSTSLFSTSVLGARTHCFTRSLQATQASFQATGQLRPHKLIPSHPPPSLLSPFRAFPATPHAKPWDTKAWGLPAALLPTVPPDQENCCFYFFCPVLLESNRFFLLALTMTYLSWQYNLNNRRAMWTGPTVHSE